MKMSNVRFPALISSKRVPAFGSLVTEDSARTAPDLGRAKTDAIGLLPTPRTST
jgi:hypothetical protein